MPENRNGGDSRALLDLLIELAAFNPSGYRAEEEAAALMDRIGGRLAARPELHTAEIAEQLGAMVLNGPAGLIRRRAAKILIETASAGAKAAISAPEVFLTLARQGNDPLSDSAPGFLGALAEAGGSLAGEALRALAAIAGDPACADLHMDAAEEIGAIGKNPAFADEAVAALAGMVSSGDELAGAAALKALAQIGKTGGPRASWIADIVGQALAGRPGLERDAIRALEKTGRADEGAAVRAVAALGAYINQSLPDDDEDRRDHQSEALDALSALGKAHPSACAADAAAYLQNACAAEKGKFQRAFLAADLGAVAAAGPGAAGIAAGFLTRLFNDSAEAEAARLAAAEALAQIAEFNPDLAGTAVSTLARAAGDPDSLLWEAAREAIAAIGAAHPVLWRQELAENFRNAAAGAGASSDTIRAVEEGVGALIDAESWRGDLARLREHARKLKF